MGLRLTIFATAAILVPASAIAQEAQPATTPTAPATPPQSAAPGQTGATPSGKTETVATTKPTKADMKAGASVFDPSGNSVGKVESVTAKGVVLDTGKVKVAIPIASLAKGNKGLVIAMTKAEVEAAAKKAG